MAQNYLGTEKIQEIQKLVNLELKDFLNSALAPIENISLEIAQVNSDLKNFTLENGKRLRPVFAAIAAISYSDSISKAQIKAVSALELVHVCALIHDDVIDQSDSRRGKTSIHKAYEFRHQENKGNGSAANYGVSAAILIGDLALVLADQMINESGLDLEAISRARKVFDAMRVELMAGQFLDIHEQTLVKASKERALKIAEYKSGKYTIERPLHFGAALVAQGKKLEELQHGFTQYGIPLGQAFQLRDDVLGVFGDSKVTGKPAGDDLREGKKTALIAFAHNQLTGGALKFLEDSLGNKNLSESDIQELQTLIEKTGALSNVENMILELTKQAHFALNILEITPLAKEMLEIMISKTTKRDS